MHTVSVNHFDNFQPLALDIIPINANMYVFVFINPSAPELIPNAMRKIPDLNSRI
jgi:hypothetical protein